MITVAVPVAVPAPPDLMLVEKLTNALVVERAKTEAAEMETVELVVEMLCREVVRVAREDEWQRVNERLENALMRVGEADEQIQVACEAARVATEAAFLAERCAEKARVQMEGVVADAAAGKDAMVVPGSLLHQMTMKTRSHTTSPHTRTPAPHTTTPHTTPPHTTSPHTTRHPHTRTTPHLTTPHLTTHHTTPQVAKGGGRCKALGDKPQRNDDSTEG